VWNMPASIKDLLHFINNDHPESSESAKIKAAPLPQISPEPWLLGTSKKSAMLAAEYGMAYAFGFFMSDKDVSEILQSYYKTFKPNKNHMPQTILTVTVYCADTTERAEEIALSSLVWSIQNARGEGQSGVPSIEDAKKYILSETEIENVKNMKRKMIIGNPQQVKKNLLDLQKRYKTDEIMIVTITYSPEDRIRSYQLIARELMDREPMA
jgi:luciferase family oxidoreductase group 1